MEPTLFLASEYTPIGRHRFIIPRSHYRAITTIALIMSDRDIQAKTKI